MLCVKSETENELPRVPVFEFVLALREDRGPAVRRIGSFVIVQPAIHCIRVRHFIASICRRMVALSQRGPRRFVQHCLGIVAPRVVRWLNSVMQRSALVVIPTHSSSDTVSALHNKPLVPTRNSEAPLLAAQRQR